MRLKSLNCPFLSKEDVIKLQKVNVDSIIQLIAHADLAALSRQTSISEKQLNMVIKFIVGQFAPIPEQCDVLVHQYLKKHFEIPFGCTQLDEKILGGVYSGEISEFTGASATGKTQLCLNLIVNMYKVNQKYTCVYIDSNKNFCLQRLVDLFNSKFPPEENQNGTTARDQTTPLVDKFLKSVKILDCQSSFHLMDILCRIKKPASISNASSSSRDQEFIASPQLLIIDSLTSLFSMFRTRCSDSDDHLGEIIEAFNYITMHMNTAVVVTTNAMSYEGGYSNLASLIHDNEYWTRAASLQIHLNNPESKKSTFTEATAEGTSDQDKENVDELDLEQANINSSNDKKNVRRFDIKRRLRPTIDFDGKIGEFTITKSGLE
jgi:hypothetical protein